MDLSIMKTRLTDAIKKRNAYFTLALGSVVINIVLALTVLFHQPNDRTIIVPAGFKQTFWIDDHGVSGSALAEMTRYFSTLILDMTPENSDYQITQVLHYTDPTTYGALKAQLIKAIDNLKTEGLTTAFFPVNVNVDVHTLQAAITGDMSYYIGKQKTNTYRTTYRAQYRYHNGRLYLKSFNEVKQHDKTLDSQ